jgi:putative nucleotidyltransferase with HDIG domain
MSESILDLSVQPSTTIRVPTEQSIDMWEYRALPKEALEIGQAVHSSPRLIAHLTLVHDVAARLIHVIQDGFPDLSFDADSVLFGAATHDIGKAACPEELTEPGHKHEIKGVELLPEHGVPDRLARFAYTHANWKDDPAIQIEDLLVALADTCWKGKRLSALEEEAVRVIVERTSRRPWEVFALLDSILQGLTADADLRLSWQAQFTAASSA